MGMISRRRGRPIDSDRVGAVHSGWFWHSRMGIDFSSLALPQAWASSLSSVGGKLILLNLLVVALWLALAGGVAVFAGIRWLAARRKASSKIEQL